MTPSNLPAKKTLGLILTAVLLLFYLPLSHPPNAFSSPAPEADNRNNQYTQKDLDASFNYYRRLSDTQKLSPNDRLAILNRILEKYSSTDGLDLSKVKLEIKKQQSAKNQKTATTPIANTAAQKSAPSHHPNPPSQPQAIINASSASPSPSKDKKNQPDNKANVSNSHHLFLWDAILEETDNEYILNLIADKPESQNSFILKDPDPQEPPKIILDLYGLSEKIKNQSKKEIDFPPETSATLKKIKIAQFEKEPAPVVRVVFFLKKPTRYSIKDTDTGVSVILLKDDSDKGKKILSAKSDTATKSDGMPPTASTKVPAAVPAPSASFADIKTTVTTVASAPPTDYLQPPTDSPQIPQAKTAYRIEPGDVLSVNITPAEDLSRDVAVSPDGDITLPLIGVVRASGNTTSRLAESLARAYSKYISNPEVSVTIKQYARRTVFITGELKSTGGFPYKDGLRLLELISQAGGFTDKADRKRIKIIRGDGGSRKTFIVDTEEIVRTGDLARDFVLEAGDMVEVPEGVKKKISILGDVRTPGYYDYKDGLKLVEAVSMAGGFTDTARITKVSILRKSSGDTQSQPITINLDEILKGTKSDFAIMPDDTIYIPRKSISSANWWVSNVLPWLSLISLILVIRGGL